MWELQLEWYVCKQLNCCHKIFLNPTSNLPHGLIISSKQLQHNVPCTSVAILIFKKQMERLSTKFNATIAMTEQNYEEFTILSINNTYQKATEKKCAWNNWSVNEEKRDIRRGDIGKPFWFLKNQFPHNQKNSRTSQIVYSWLLSAKNPPRITKLKFINSPGKRIMLVP